MLQPVQGAGDEKGAYLVAAEVKLRRVPLGVKPLAWIGVLIKSSAVEGRESVWIGGKVPGHPIEDHAKPGGMTPIHEMSELRRGAVLGGRRELADAPDNPRSRRNG